MREGIGDNIQVINPTQRGSSFWIRDDEERHSYRVIVAWYNGALSAPSSLILIPASTNAEVYTPGTTNSSQLQALLPLIRQPEEKIILRKNGELLRQKDEEEEDIKKDDTVE